MFKKNTKALLYFEISAWRFGIKCFFCLTIPELPDSHYSTLTLLKSISQLLTPWSPLEYQQQTGQRQFFSVLIESIFVWSKEGVDSLLLILWMFWSNICLKWDKCWMIELLWHDGSGQHIKLMKIYPFTFSFPLTQLYRNFRIHFLNLWTYTIYIYSAMSENDLSLQTKGVLILVPGIFGVLSNITLMLIILSIASAQRYCTRNVTSLFEQKPLYQGTETEAVSRI